MHWRMLRNIYIYGVQFVPALEAETREPGYTKRLAEVDRQREADTKRDAEASRSILADNQAEEKQPGAVVALQCFAWIHQHYLTISLFLTFFITIY